MNITTDSHCRNFIRCLAVIFLASALWSCSIFHGYKTTHSAKPTAKTRYLAEDYIKHLTLAELTLRQNGADSSVAADNLNVINAYASQKPTNPERQAIVVLEYKIGTNSSRQQIVAPVSFASKNPGFSSLQTIMKRLNDNAVALHNLRIITTTIAPDAALKLPDADVNTVLGVLDDQQQRLLNNAQEFPLLEDARTQLKLVRFFMKHRFRDAAYLSVDNVKRQLASASQNTAMDTEAVKSLSQELEALEIQLRKTLPFTLSTQ